MKDNLKASISEIRQFNRFYTNYLGVLDKSYLDSEYSLSEIRVLYQISITPKCNLKILSNTFKMDKGYLSRIIKKLEKLGLLYKAVSNEDKRAQTITLTPAGKKTVRKLNALSDERILKQLNGLNQNQVNELIQNLIRVEALLTGSRDIIANDISIRTDLNAGDMGYIVFMHGRIYGEEYGYTSAFEGYVSEVAAGFLKNYDAGKERVWIAEHNGKIIGTIAIINGNSGAELRWFLIEPNYRGLGLGYKLLKAAVKFAKTVGYSKISLVTTSDLHKAMSMYESVGFKKVAERPNDLWKAGLKEVEFELKL